MGRCATQKKECRMWQKKEEMLTQPTMHPLSMRVVDVQVPVIVPLERRQPLPVKYDAGTWEEASASDSLRSVPPSPTSVRKEDAGKHGQNSSWAFW